MTRLTETAFRGSLPRPRDKQIDIPDGTVSGLFVRLGNGYTATWSLRIRVSGEAGVSQRGLKLKGRKYRLTLGTYPEVSIERAREHANEYRAQAKEGNSPVDALERASTARGMTIDALSKRFMDEYVRSRKLRSERKYEQAIVTHITPNLGDVLVDILTREHVRNLMRKVRVRIPRGEPGPGRPRGGDEAVLTVLSAGQGHV